MKAKETSKRFALLALLLIPLALLGSRPSVAEAKINGQRPSFSILAERIRFVSKKLDRLLFSLPEKKIEAQPLVVARVQTKKPAVTTDTPPPKPVDKPVATPAAASTPAELPTEPLSGAAPRTAIRGSGAFIAEMSGGRTEAFTMDRAPAVAYWKNQYFLVEGDKTVAVSTTPIRFKPTGSGAALSLPGYTDMNWNNTANLNWFRGLIEIVYSKTSNNLWAVNELYLEDYLRGIAEAKHDSAEEHIKVMAILARSYAVHHLGQGGRHAGEPFHLKNSRNGNGDDQVYRGYLAEVRQPRIAKAAADTAGTVVTYNGKPVITPYSSRPSGHTRSPAEAGWNVDWPWVVSVPDPDTTGMTRLGHGVGLSGYGSRKRAERGNTAAQITAYYFPGTSLGQVATGDQLVRVAIVGTPVN